MYITEHLEHIDIIYYNCVSSVMLMVKEHYNTPEYDGSLFILNWFSCNITLEKSYKRVIYYCLEHEPTQKYWETHPISDCENLIDRLHNDGVNEVWEMDYMSTFGKIFHEKYDVPVKYRPVRYT